MIAFIRNIAFTRNVRLTRNVVRTCTPGAAAQRLPSVFAMIVALVTLAAVPKSSVAQETSRFSFSWRGVPAQRVLDQLAAETRLNIVFSSERVAGRVVFCSRANATPTELLDCALKSAGLDYVVSSSGAFIVIDNVELSRLRGDVGGRVVDAESGEPLPGAHVLMDTSFGTATTPDGLFTFSRVVTGWHDVVATYVGYESATHRVLIEPTTPGPIEIPLTRATKRFEPIVVDGLAQRLPSHSLGSEGALDGVNGTVASAIAYDVARGASMLPGISVQRPIAEMYIQGSPPSEHLTLLDGAPVRDPVSLGRHMTAFSPLALRSVSVEKAGFGAALGSHLAGVVRVEHDLPARPVDNVSLLVDPASINGRVATSAAVGAGRLSLMGAVRHSSWNLYQAPSVADLLRSWSVVDPLLWALWSSYRVENAGWLAGIDAAVREPDVSFSDLHLAGRLTTGRFHTIGFSAYRAGNHITSSVAGTSRYTAYPDVLSLSRDEYDWTNWAGQINHAALLGSRAIVSSKVIASRHESSIGYATSIARTSIDPVVDPDGATAERSIIFGALADSLQRARGAYEANSITELRAQTEIDYAAVPGASVNVQVFAANANSRFRVGNQFVRPLWNRADGWEIGGHVVAQLTPGKHVQLEPGFRATYLPELGEVFVEPRLGIRYDSSPKAWGHYAFRVAGGLYRQFTQQLEIASASPTAVVPSIRFWMPLDGSVSPPSAWHLASELLLVPRGALTARAEVYYKEQTRLLSLDYAGLMPDDELPAPAPTGLNQNELIVAGRGYAYGAAARVQFERIVRVAASYDWSVAKRAFPVRFGGAATPVPWNVPHRLTASLQSPIALIDRRLSATLVWQSAWAGGWSLRQGYYDYLEGNTTDPIIPDISFSTPASDGGTDFHQLDVTLAYEFDAAGSSVRVQAGVENVFNRANVYDYAVRAATGVDRTATRVARLLPGRQPVFSVSARF